MVEVAGEKLQDKVALEAKLAHMLETVRKDKEGNDEGKGREKGKEKEKKKSAEEILTENVGKIWDSYPGIKSVEIEPDNLTAKFLYEEITINKGVTRTQVDEFYKSLVITTKVSTEEEKLIRDEQQKVFDGKMKELETMYKGKKEYATKVEELKKRNEKTVNETIAEMESNKVAIALKDKYNLVRNEKGGYIPADKFLIFTNPANLEDLSMRKPYDESEGEKYPEGVKGYKMIYETDGYGKDEITLVDKNDKEENKYKFEFGTALFGDYGMEELVNKKDLELHKTKITNRIQNCVLIKESIGEMFIQERATIDNESPIKIKNDNDVFVVGKRLKEEVEVPAIAKETVSIIRGEYGNEKRMLKLKTDILEQYQTREEYTRNIFEEEFKKASSNVKSKLQIAQINEIQKGIEEVKKNPVVTTNEKTKAKKYVNMYYKFTIPDLKELGFNVKKQGSKEEEYENSVPSS